MSLRAEIINRPASLVPEMEKTQAELRWAFKQAHASSRIEGHTPTPEHLAACEAVIAGTMTIDEAISEAISRGQTEDRAAAGMDGNSA